MGATVNNCRVSGVMKGSGTVTRVALCDLVTAAMPLSGALTSGARANSVMCILPQFVKINNIENHGELQVTRRPHAPGSSQTRAPRTGLPEHSHQACAPRFAPSLPTWELDPRLPRIRQPGRRWCQLRVS